MPYPESCPECGSTFRNTGTHFTARRNEVGRHVLLELGCQNTTRRFWWDFTTGNLTEDGRPSAARRGPMAEALSTGTANTGPLHAESNGSFHLETNGHATLSTLELPKTLESMSPIPDLPKDLEPRPSMPDVSKHLESRSPTLDLPKDVESSPVEDQPSLPVEPALELESRAVDSGVRPGERPEPPAGVEPEPEPQPQIGALLGPPPGAAGSLKDAFVRQLQLDRLTLRQMRSWLMSEEARRAIEVAAGATEATYERLALILFGSELPQLLGKPSAAPQNPGMSAEDRLELQREKARIRARLRRAAAKAARQSD
jgi:hypothetical protein